MPLTPSLHSDGFSEFWKGFYLYTIPKLFADDAKLFKPVPTVADCEDIQLDVRQLENWAGDWQLNFHPRKCTVLRIGKNHPDFQYKMSDSGQEVPLDIKSSEKDLGVWIDKDLNFELHITEMVKKANRIAGLMWRTFEHIDKQVFKLLYTSMVRPHLEYGAPIWSPHLWKMADLIESVQRRATKRVPNLSNLTYEERLKRLKMPSLLYRRLRGDLINVYKYIHGYYETTKCLPPFNVDTISRGHNLKLTKIRSRSNIRMYFFSNRVVDWWNLLPSDVVNAQSVNSFKARIDNYFKDHPVVYDYRALDHPHRTQISVY